MRCRSWIVGLAPEAGRFFFYWFVLFWFHQWAVSLFRLMGVALRPLTLANAGSVFLSMIVMTFGEPNRSRLPLLKTLAPEIRCS